MAGALEPIAALTFDDYGPINTIVSIVLTALTILFTSIRLVIRYKKALGFGQDDLVFGISVCFGIATSVTSHSCVKAGLGRHQDNFDEAQVERYFKGRYHFEQPLHFWETQLLGIMALASAKLSIVLMLRRIDPVRLGPRPLKWLIPMVTGYTVLAYLLIGFQCQLPRPWVLSPKMCSTHGNVYYPITIFNILTDLVLAFWIVPAIWNLQMKRHEKCTVVAIFGSRLAVCIMDIGRMVVIRKALQLEDQTWSNLHWAIMDQLVIHVSINHATLPHVNVFLSNLQTGLLVTRITTTQPHYKAPNSNSSANNYKLSPHSLITTRAGRSEADKQKQGDSRYEGWNSLLTVTKLVFGAPKAPSISEQPLATTR